jgi:hypothetical protein
MRHSFGMPPVPQVFLVGNGINQCLDVIGPYCSGGIVLSIVSSRANHHRYCCTAAEVHACLISDDISSHFH